MPLNKKMYDGDTMPPQELKFKKKIKSGTENKLTKIIQKFINASLSSSVADRGISDHPLIYLVYMFGAVSMLCHSEDLDTKDTLVLYKSIFIDSSTNTSDEEQNEVLKTIITAANIPEYQGFMTQGSEAFIQWHTNKDSLAPDRLAKIFSSKS